MYDNAASGRLSLAVVAAQDAPNGSGYVLRIRYAGGGAAGGPAPGFGGVVQLLLPSLGTAPTRPGYYQPGTTILCKIVALIPADKNLYFASNAIGDAATGAAIEFLTSNAGTGDWQTYIVRLRIGRTGNFSSTGFLYVGDGSGAAFDWYLARYDQIDVASGSITFMGAGGLADEDGVPRYKADLLTQLGTAAAIAGQGSLATLSALAYGSPYLAGFGPLAALDRVRLGVNGVGGVVDSLNSRWLGDYDLITSLGVAGAINGQGNLATQNNVAYGSQISGLPAPIQLGNLRDGLRIDASQVQYWGGPAQVVVTVDSLRPQEAGANVTEARTAAAISGQGSLATQNTAGWSQIVSVPTRLRPSPIFGESWLDISVLPYSNGAGVDTLRPQEAGANVTEYRVASAIAGQGALATRSNITDGFLAGALAVRLQPHPLNSNFLGTATIAYPGGAGVSDLQPQEAGANKTETRIAAAIVGQGSGATASSLAQLDPSAASQLAAVAGGGVQVAALYEPIRKVMAPGATINFDAAAGISAGGDSGNVGLLIQVSLADANSWSNIAAGTERFVSASEPAYVTASGSFTNTSGAQRVYEFRAIDVRTPGSAGGWVVGSQSFLRG